MNPKGTLVCEGPSGIWWEQRMRASNQKRPRKEMVGDDLQKLTSLITDKTGGAPALTHMVWQSSQFTLSTFLLPFPSNREMRTGKNFLFQDISLSENRRGGPSSPRSQPNTA